MVKGNHCICNAVEMQKEKSRSTRNSWEVAQAKRASTEKVTVKFHFQVDWVCSHCWARLCEHLLGKSV